MFYRCVYCECCCFKIHSLGEKCFLTSNIGLNAVIIVEGTFGKIQAFLCYDSKYYCLFFLCPSLPLLFNPYHLSSKMEGVSLFRASLFSEGFVTKCNRGGRTAMTVFSFLSPVSAGSRLTADYVNLNLKEICYWDGSQAVYCCRNKRSWESPQ